MSENSPATGNPPATGAAALETPWEGLRAAAAAVRTNAYAPYSQYPVGAAALAEDGRVVVGCNVENASYGLTLCAECALVGALAAGGGGRLSAFVCVNAADEVILPCGRCRQLLFEHGGPELLVLTPLGVWTLDRLLPQAFGPADLDLTGRPSRSLTKE